VVAPAGERARPALAGGLAGLDACIVRDEVEREIASSTIA
jgi:hypothetical protein